MLQLVSGIHVLKKRSLKNYDTRFISQNVKVNCNRQECLAPQRVRCSSGGGIRKGTIEAS